MPPIVVLAVGGAFGNPLFAKNIPFTHIPLDKRRKIWYHTTVCGCARIHSTTHRSYACGCARIHSTTHRIKLRIRGYGGIGRRIRFRILRQTVCRFDPCYPHQHKRECKSTPFCVGAHFFSICGLFLSQPSKNLTFPCARDIMDKNNFFCGGAK